ncbi:XRE family transcriptional regulator [Clostridiales bacterium AHG0011]|uniref:helix-turn-helix transcriptional regulator n=1 Tax=Enterocloster TaxID=2719313 RepID=UPI00189ED552|nr:helix-turn-helix transcriptional regulator [Enterocloster bolteae]MCC3394123.1 XRE family transcriptional regulator [Clostridiales bacterium AHG0011]
MTKKSVQIQQLQFDENIYNTIRRNIKKYRKERGLTSAQLAEMVDLSHDFIRQIESEKVGYNFSVETFYKISVALGVELDKLIKKQ